MNMHRALTLLGWPLAAGAVAAFWYVRFERRKSDEVMREHLLIEGSSLGTPGARQLRERTDLGDPVFDQLRSPEEAAAFRARVIASRENRRPNLP